MKNSLKRPFVGVVCACARVASRLVRRADDLLIIAARHGGSEEQELAWRLKGGQPPSAAQSWGVRDFLFFMDEMSGRRTSKHTPARLRASVIIPVFNKAGFTFQCLRSLIQEVDFTETEIIVVNNASRDETDRVLSYLDDFVQVIRNEENRGFVDACNQGAAAARGEYLVFLNNDTVVERGWLKHLLETVEENPSVGAVGSLLLYPDGRIQEAGAGVWRDGAAYHYGSGKSSENRQYNFAREVDYCSGASLLVRKEIFERLGGFDRRYAPAYYEDVDLCFGVRLLGYKVVFQPASRLTHFEGATSGRDTQIGFKHFQEINREKFAAKWRAVLEREHVDESEASLERAANRSRAPRIMVFDDRVPTPDLDAGSARMFIILKSLSKWAQVVFVPLSRPPTPDYERRLWKEGVETASVVGFRRLLKERNFQVAVVSRPDVADTLLSEVRGATKNIKIVFDMVDLYFLRHEREHALTGDPATAREAARYKELELRFARAADLLWCASSEDRKVMAREVPSTPSIVVPTIHPLHERGKPFEQREGLLFIGNLHHRPNADAVHYFMKEIYPLVQKELAGVKFYVVGANASPEIAAYASDDVRVLGYVPDIDPVFQSSRVMVAPIRFGAGFKGKIGDALSYGLPVVTTSVGAEGIGLRHGEEALIADDPQAFADAVTRAYRERDLWQRLADNGYTHVEKHYTPQIIGDQLRAALKDFVRPEKQLPATANKTN